MKTYVKALRALASRADPVHGLARFQAKPERHAAHEAAVAVSFRLPDGPLFMDLVEQDEAVQLRHLQRADILIWIDGWARAFPAEVEPEKEDAS